MVSGRYRCAVRRGEPIVGMVAPVGLAITWNASGALGTANTVGAASRNLIR